MTTTTNAPHIVKVQIHNLTADVDALKNDFQIMMNRNTDAKMAPATSEERWENTTLRNHRQEVLVKDIQKMIANLQEIKDSVENFWN